MTILINLGSVIGDGEGWTNTVEQARKTAQEWHAKMLTDGLVDVVLLDGEHIYEGRWVFRFQHAVTGVVVNLETHGIDDVAAYEAAHIFTPRVYWNGCSTSTPRLQDWAADGFKPVRTYRPVDE